MLSVGNQLAGRPRGTTELFEDLEVRRSGSDDSSVGPPTQLRQKSNASSSVDGRGNTRRFVVILTRSERANTEIANGSCPVATPVIHSAYLE